MKMRTLGRNGPRVSGIGLGCMRMSNFAGPKSSTDEESIATIRAALDAGINFLNTGDFYGMGHNELLVGQAIKGRRDQALISVKFGALRSPSGQFLGIDVRPNAVKNFAAYSLQRLGVDVIDIYQPGRIDPNVPVEETVGAIADLIKEGKVRYLGLSETGAENIRRAHKGYDNDSSLFGPFVPFMPVFPLKYSLPLRRASFDERASACASSLVSSCR